MTRRLLFLYLLDCFFMFILLSKCSFPQEKIMKLYALRSHATNIYKFIQIVYQTFKNSVLSNTYQWLIKYSNKQIFWFLVHLINRCILHMFEKLKLISQTDKVTWVEQRSRIKGSLPKKVL